MTEFDDPATGFNRRVGELLREVRKQRRLALQEVEAQTGEEFKASVVGAYERGERSLSLPRLARLAEFYEVPIGRLLPGRDAGASAADETPQHPARLMIDLVALAAFEGDPSVTLRRFLRGLQMERGDLRGSTIAVRHSDRSAIAAILDVPVDELDDRLAMRGLLVGGD
ncbi:MAG: helix-turn-helix domain-containing protein [Acidimicrobiia bacterium]|nr:helix-turn-helix domain-containing protein [Acidimicrobiia bacterium]